MTKKLFWEQPLLTECIAKVTGIEGNKVKLDQTIFFAFSGGQSSDEGTINGIKVINALKIGDKENIIDVEYELGRQPPFKIGDKVEVKINREIRERLSKLHSAAHIAYYFILDKLGKLDIIGSNINPEKARIDLLYDQPLNKLLPEIEEKINKFILEGHQIETKSDGNNPDLRWWSCGDWKMPCGGTHVGHTNTIGSISLKRKNIGKGKERVEITLNS